MLLFDFGEVLSSRKLEEVFIYNHIDLMSLRSCYIYMKIKRCDDWRN